MLFKAGLLEGDDHSLRVHSIRKFFKTQLMALGMQSDYVDYMMGHTIDTYHDIQSKGIDFLRGIYARANLRLRAEPKPSPLTQLKVFARGLGLDPDKFTMESCFAEPHRAIVSPEEIERQEIQMLSSAIKESIKQEVISEITESSQIHLWSGGAAEI